MHFCVICSAGFWETSKLKSLMIYVIMNKNSNILIYSVLHVHMYIEYITWWIKTSFVVAVNWNLLKKIGDIDQKEIYMIKWVFFE